MLADERAKMWDDVIEWIEKGIIKPGSYANFLYHDFMTDPIDAIASAYKALGLPMSEEGRKGMHDFLEAHPHGMHDKHKYKRYQEYFGIPNEG